MKWLDETKARFANTSFANNGLTARDVRRLISRVEKLEQRITEAIEWIDSGEPRQSRVILRVALAEGEE